MRTLTLLVFIAFVVPLLTTVASAQCNCPNINGSCVNCASATACCGFNTSNPTCLLPGNQCCLANGATQCLAKDTCCGGHFDGGFCCTEGSSCCANEFGFGSRCCGPNQVCCSGHESFCCDAETEVCGMWGACLQKRPFTPSPDAKGGLAWATNLTTMYAVYGPAKVNATHVVASGGSGVSWVRLSDGKATLALTTPAQYPLIVAGGHVIVANYQTTMTLNITTGQPGWNATMSADPQFPMVAWGDYLVVSSYTGLTVYDARSGVALYSFTVSGEMNGGPVVTKYGTVAVSANQFFIFDVRTGTVLVNVSSPCQFGATTAVDDTNGVVISCNLVAYDAKTGAVRWSVAGGSITAYSLAVTSDAYVTVGWTYYQWVAGLSKSKGAVLWNVTIGTPYSLVVIGAGERVLVVQDYVAAYHAATGKLEWNCSSVSFSPQLLSLGFAFDDGHRFAYTVAQNRSNPLALVAVNMTDGTVADYFEAGMWPQGFYINPPVLAGGYALFLSEDGFLYSLHAL